MSIFFSFVAVNNVENVEEAGKTKGAKRSNDLNEKDEQNLASVDKEEEKSLVKDTNQSQHPQRYSGVGN